MISTRVVAFSLLSACTAACGATSSRERPTAPPTSSATVYATATAVPNPKLTVVAGLTSSAAASLIGRTVTGARPNLALTGVPPDWEGDVSFSESGSFTSIFRSPGGAKSVMLALVLANPPLPGARTLQSEPNFHGDGHSLYEVEDGVDPTSVRRLIWTEPGTWSVQPSLGGVPYYLVTTGMTDAEFWNVANSLHSIQN